MVVVVGVTEMLPDVATVPMFGLIETVFALAVVHESVALWPDVIDVGVAVNEPTTGATETVTLCVALPALFVAVIV